jgi:branched-chain amino acid transport system ATP-binding protein
MREALLQVTGLNAWYGESHILHGVDLQVCKGEVVTLLGRNGAGKTTTLKSVMGMVGRREGSIAFEGADIGALPSNKVARLGIAFCSRRGYAMAASVSSRFSTCSPI